MTTADGSVRFYDESIDMKAWRNLASQSGG